MGAVIRISWPDGGSTVEQPALGVNLLEMIHASLAAKIKRESEDA